MVKETESPGPAVVHPSLAEYKVKSFLYTVSINGSPQPRKIQRSTYQTVLRIRDVYPGSRILIFTNPGSRILDPGFRIPDPGFHIPDLGSRIPDPKTGTKERGEKKFVVMPFFVAKNFTKL
jgi:hypothetical protein